VTLDITLFYDDAMDQIEITRKGLVSLQNDLNNKEIINNIFRAIHTLKGSAAIYNLEDIVNLVHKVENLLDDIRNERLNMSENLRNLLFNAKDIIETRIELTCKNQRIDQFTNLQTINLEHELNEQLKSKVLPTILIVDKDSKVRDFASSTAKEAGYTIETAENCINAIQKLKTETFDLIFSDLSIIHPKKIRMFREIKEIDHCKLTPIVVLIKQKNETLNSQSKSLGVTAWLKKPFDKTSFLTAIEKLI